MGTDGVKRCAQWGCNRAVRRQDVRTCEHCLTKFQRKNKRYRQRQKAKKEALKAAIRLDQIQQAQAKRLEAGLPPMLSSNPEHLIRSAEKIIPTEE